MRGLVAMLSLLHLSGAGSATTIHVPSEVSTIQAGIDAAANGDTVLVAPGVYLEHLVFDTESIELIATNGDSVTSIMAAADSIAIITFLPDKGNTSRIQGFTISGAYAANGVDIEPGNSPTLVNCTFSYNTSSALGHGGAVYCNAESTLIQNCVFHSNSAWQGVLFVSYAADNCIIERSVFRDNFTADHGGAMCIEAASGVIVRRNLIYDNVNEDDWGGAVYIGVTDSCQVLNNTIVSNTALRGFGAGITLNTVNMIDIRNNIVAFNIGGSGVFGNAANSITCEYNDVYGNGAGDYNGIAASTGSLMLDPLFTDTSRKGFTLQYLSPCINAGDPSSQYTDPDGSRNDIGALWLDVQAPTIVSVSIEGIDTALHLINHIPVVEWVPFDPLDVKAQSQYEIAFGTDNDWAFAEMWNPAPVASSDTFVTYAGAALVDGATYWLRLRVHNGVKWSDWYEESFRMNSVPSAPVALGPLSNDVTGQTPTLWVQNAVDAEGDMLTYDFSGFHDTDCFFGGPIDTVGVAEGVDSTGAQMGLGVPLGENCIYWWSARAFDGYEYSAESVTQMFFVDGTPEPPTDFSCDYPPDTSGLPVFEMKPTFDWGRSYDGDPLDTVRYKIEVALDSAFVVGFDTTGLLATSHAFADSLWFGQHYWWRVTAVDKTSNEVLSINQPDFWTWELGDLDHSHTVDIADLTRLVDFMFKFGPALNPAFIGDVDGNCSVDIADLTYLVAYMFKSGPPPKVGCEDP